MILNCQYHTYKTSRYPKHAENPIKDRQILLYLFLNNLPALIIFLAGGHLSRKIYAVVGRSTATTEAAAMACIPVSLTSSRWLIALAPTSAPNLK